MKISDSYWRQRHRSANMSLLCCPHSPQKEMLSFSCKLEKIKTLFPIQVHKPFEFDPRTPGSVTTR